MTTIRFGTAGWRALIAQDFTFANVRIVSQAIADYLKHENSTRNSLSSDTTPFSFETFARNVAEVLTANGVQVALCQSDAPTPVIALRSCTAKPQEGQRDRQPIRRTIRASNFPLRGADRPAGSDALYRGTVRVLSERRKDNFAHSAERRPQEKAGCGL